MLILSVPGGLLATTFLVAPGVFWSWMCWPAESRTERLAVGLALGFAFQMHVAALLSAGPGITTLSVLAATLVALLLAGLLVWRMRIPHRQSTRLDHRGTLPLVGLLAAVTILQLLPLAVHQVPQGWDPSFHSLLASATVNMGRLPGWTPYEPIPSNYPYGPHVIIAEMSLLSGIRVDQAFAVLLSAVLPAITALALYVLARRALPTLGAALATVAAYALLGNWGSLDYPRWGGLPNALGYFILLTFLTVFFGSGFERIRVVVGGILLGAIPLAHHHVMLTTIILLGAYGAVLITRAWRARDADVRREALQSLRCLLLMAAVALVTVAYYAVPLALRAREIQDSSVLRYFDHDPGIIFTDNGWLLWALTLGGVGMLIVQRGWRHKRLLANPALEFSAVAGVALMVAFVCGYYLYRAYSLDVYHQPYVAFTSTRFLTDLTYFIAPFAGLALDAIWRQTARLPELLKRIGRPSASSSVLARSLIVLVLLVTASVTILSQFQPGEGTLRPGEAEAFAWIHAHTAQDAFVVNLDQNNRWAPFFTQREVAFTPIPVSEFTLGYVAEKQYLVNQALALQGNSSAPRIVAAASAGLALPALMGRPVVLITDQATAGVAGTPAFVAGVERVYLVPSLFERLQPPDARSAQWWSGSGKPPVGWQMPGAAQSGWGAIPPHAGMAYMRLTLSQPLPSGVAVACRAEGAVSLFLDGQRIEGGCRNGQRVPLPGLEMPGSHLLAAQAQLGQNLGPWFDLFVLAPGGSG